LKIALKEGRLDVATATLQFRQILEGVAAAHKLGIAHLDLSPNNVLVDARGALRVMDFGLARLVSGAAPPELDEDIHGTPRYMSPEHFSGGALDTRTDVFVLGLIFFEMLAGVPAGNAIRFKELNAQILQARFEWPLLERSGAPPELVSVLREALARAPEHRFRDAGEMLGALTEVQAVADARNNRNLAVQFLLRRLQRRPEFPAFSNSITEINRLTGEHSDAGLDELTAVIMRDFSLTNRLIKLANSAYFARSDSGVSTIQQAVARVGTKKLRLLSNGLLMFEHLRGDTSALQDALVESFVAGLLGRMLAQQMHREHAEEAFVASMFNRLGRNLLVYYLEDEHTEVMQRIAAGMSQTRAEQAVLGTTSAAVGAAISALWKFPPTIIASMASLPTGALASPVNDADLMRYLAHLPNELCGLAASTAGGPPRAALDELCRRYRAVFRTSTEGLAGALEVTLEKFSDIAQTLGIDMANNGFCVRSAAFLEEFRLAAEDESATATA
jgi:HD-like signal output (HDOD) protein